MFSRVILFNLLFLWAVVSQILMVCGRTWTRELQEGDFDETYEVANRLQLDLRLQTVIQQNVGKTSLIMLASNTIFELNDAYQIPQGVNLTLASDGSATLSGGFKLNRLFYNDGGVISLSNVIISNFAMLYNQQYYSSSGIDGGIFYNLGGQIIMTDCIITNFIANRGGVVFNTQKATFKSMRCIYEDNLKRDISDTANDIYTLKGTIGYNEMQSRMIIDGGIFFTGEISNFIYDRSAIEQALFYNTIGSDLHFHNMQKVRNNNLWIIYNSLSSHVYAKNCKFNDNFDGIFFNSIDSLVDMQNIEISTFHNNYMIRNEGGFSVSMRTCRFNSVSRVLYHKRGNSDITNCDFNTLTSAFDTLYFDDNSEDTDTGEGSMQILNSRINQRAIVNNTLQLFGPNRDSVTVIYNLPTAAPSSSPSTSPTIAPSYSPSKVPSNSPSVVPSISPTFSPSSKPTQFPSASPTYNPTMSPTKNPTKLPSSSPSIQHNEIFGKMSIEEFTVNPSSTPSASPSALPSTSSPSGSPTTKPTRQPTTGTPSTTRRLMSRRLAVDVAQVAQSLRDCLADLALVLLALDTVEVLVEDENTLSYEIRLTTNNAATINGLPATALEAANYINDFIDGNSASLVQHMSTDLGPLIAINSITADIATRQPTASPSSAPSSAPSKSPSSSSPSKSPSMVPSTSPTRQPTTLEPTRSPSSAMPTSSPTLSVPTFEPTPQPTSQHPTSVPSTSPTGSPTLDFIATPESTIYSAYGAVTAIVVVLNLIIILYRCGAKNVDEDKEFAKFVNLFTEEYDHGGIVTVLPCFHDKAGSIGSFTAAALLSQTNSNLIKNLKRCYAIQIVSNIAIIVITIAWHSECNSNCICETANAFALTLGVLGLFWSSSRLIALSSRIMEDDHIISKIDNFFKLDNIDLKIIFMVEAFFVVLGFIAQSYVTASGNEISNYFQITVGFIITVSSIIIGVTGPFFSSFIIGGADDNPSFIVQPLTVMLARLFGGTLSISISCYYAFNHLDFDEISENLDIALICVGVVLFLIQFLQMAFDMFFIYVRPTSSSIDQNASHTTIRSTTLIVQSYFSHRRDSQFAWALYYIDLYGFLLLISSTSIAIYDFKSNSVQCTWILIAYSADILVLSGILCLSHILTHAHAMTNDDMDDEKSNGTENPRHSIGSAPPRSPKPSGSKSSVRSAVIKLDKAFEKQKSIEMKSRSLEMDDTDGSRTNGSLLGSMNIDTLELVLDDAVAAAAEAAARQFHSEELEFERRNAPSVDASDLKSIAEGLQEDAEDSEQEQVGLTPESVQITIV